MTNKTKIKVLEKAIKLLSGREGAKRWCKGSMAVDKDGQPVDEGCKEAVKFCAVGAILRSQKNREDFSLWDDFDGLSITNDNKGRGAALRVMRKRLKELQAK